jgi:hypothetical protein
LINNLKFFHKFQVKIQKSIHEGNFPILKEKTGEGIILSSNDEKTLNDYVLNYLQN